MSHRSRQEDVIALVKRPIGIIASLTALIALLAPLPAQAQVDVHGTYSFASNIYSYSFTVVNNTADDVLLVTARLPDRTFVVMNPSAPTGFSLNYSEADGNSNGVPDAYLDFLADDIFAPGTTTGPFTFDTSTPEFGFVFEGLNSTGDSVTGNVTVAPEPATLALLLPGLMSAGIAIRRRK